MGKATERYVYTVAELVESPGYKSASPEDQARLRVVAGAVERTQRRQLLQEKYTVTIRRQVPAWELGPVACRCCGETGDWLAWRCPACRRAKRAAQARARRARASGRAVVTATEHFRIDSPAEASCARCGEKFLPRRNTAKFCSTR